MLAHRAYRFRNFVFVRQDSESFRQAVMSCSSKTQQQSFAAGGRSFARRFFCCQIFFHRTEFSLGKDGIEVRKHVQRKAALQKPAQRNLTCPFKQPVRGSFSPAFAAKAACVRLSSRRLALTRPASSLATSGGGLTLIDNILSLELEKPLI